jgi:prepilin-type N-terminal cleavage/methylation domain-containing protein
MKISIRSFKQKNQLTPKGSGGTLKFVKKPGNESGFSLVEVICAMVILLIALLGVFVTFTYSVNYNAGNSSRSQALSLLQEEVEQMRSKQFTPDFTDPDLYGGVKADRHVTEYNGNKFKIAVSIDNNPATPNVIEANEATDDPTIKQISITVTLDSPTPGWQTAVPATVILQRVRGN